MGSLAKDLLWFPEWGTTSPPADRTQYSQTPKEHGGQQSLCVPAAEPGQHPAIASASKFSNPEASNRGQKKEAQHARQSLQLGDFQLCVWLSNKHALSYFFIAWGNKSNLGKLNSDSVT